MIVAFTLSMPGVASWNGRWTGEGKKYVVVKSYRSKAGQAKISERFGSHSHRWTDGWAARVDVKAVTPAQAKKLRKESAGFCGYEWMIDTIETYGRIRTRVSDGHGRRRFEDEPTPSDWGQPRETAGTAKG